MNTLERKYHESPIADKIERLEFWTSLMRGAIYVDGSPVPVSPDLRLKASECLAKARGDFNKPIKLARSASAPIFALAAKVELEDRLRMIRDPKPELDEWLR